MEIYAKLLEWINTGRQADVLTLVAAPADRQSSVGQILLVSLAGEPEGLIVDAGVTALVMAEIRKTDWQKPIMLTIAGGEYKLFWDRISGPTAALVLGAGHISLPLVELLTMTGYSVTVVDDRPDFANKNRFPKAEKVICDDFSRALEKLDSTDYSAVIVVTRGHRSDMDCLRRILSWPAKRYVGMIGSQRRVYGVIEMLSSEGFDADRLQCLHAPIGIDIGAQTPEEIAISIVAEIIGEKRGTNYQPLSASRRNQNG